MSVRVFQIGARRRYLVARTLHNAALLDCLVTDISADYRPYQLISGLFKHCSGAVARFTQRTTGLPAEKIIHLPLFAMSGFLSGNRRLPRFSMWARRNAEFCHRALSKGFGDADTVYVYNGAGLEIIEAAKQRSMNCIVDQTAAPVAWDASLLAAEREKWPDWYSERESIEGWQDLSDRETAEWALADRIICPSDYVMDCLRKSGVSAEKCVKIDRSDSISNSFESLDKESQETQHRDLRVLFLGTLCLRKGIPYLNSAMQELSGKGFEFKLAGSIDISDYGVDMLKRYGEVLGPVAYDRVQELLDWADVLVLPTLSEGSANVCHEAAARGIAVVTTHNSGWTGEGFFVAPCSPGDIVDCLLGIQNLCADSAGFRKHSSDAGKHSYQDQLIAALTPAYD